MTPFDPDDSNSLEDSSDSEFSNDNQDPTTRQLPQRAPSKLQMTEPEPSLSPSRKSKSLKQSAFDFFTTSKNAALFKLKVPRLNQDLLKNSESLFPPVGLASSELVEEERILSMIEGGTTRANSSPYWPTRDREVINVHETVKGPKPKDGALLTRTKTETQMFEIWSEQFDKNNWATNPEPTEEEETKKSVQVKVVTVNKSNALPPSRQLKFIKCLLDPNRPFYCGLTNHNLCCYSNSCLQVLFTSVAIRSYFLSNSQVGSVHASLSELFTEMLDESEHNISPRFSPSVSPDKFNRIFRAAKSQFVSNQSHDCHEYFTALLELIHQEANQPAIRPKSGVPEPSNAREAWTSHVRYVDNSTFSQLLMGQIETSLTCDTCGQQKLSWSSIWQLSLGLATSLEQQFNLEPDENLTLNDCIREFSADENLTDESAPLCVTCGTCQPASKKQVISHVPQGLIIHLKRFYDDGTKNNRSVEIETNMYLNSGGQVVQFILHSAIIHQGSQINGGHYMTLHREDDNLWILIDDHSLKDGLTNLDAANMLRNYAYLLLYSGSVQAGEDD